MGNPQNSPPSEEEMRTQMFRTMVALERAANLIADCFGSAPSPQEPLPRDMDQFKKILDGHSKALGILASFAQFKETFGFSPEASVALHVGMRACQNCCGTGWEARDEMCGVCGRRGFIKA